MENEAVALAKLQGQIVERLGLEAKNTIFNYHEHEGVIRLDLITINPVHDQSFLFHSTKAENKQGTVEQMMEYVEEHFPKEKSYTVQWMKIGKSDLQTSYFRAKNIYALLDKFYFEREKSNYQIFSISLNPVT